MINNFISSCMAVGCLAVVGLIFLSFFVPISFHFVGGGVLLGGIFVIASVLSAILAAGSSAKDKIKNKR